MFINGCRVWVVVVLLATIMIACDKRKERILTDTPILLDPEEGPIDDGPPNIKIGVFWPPTIQHVTDVQFKILGESNINVLQYVVPYTEAENITILKKARANGFRANIFDSRVNGSEQDLVSMVNAYKSYTGLDGYYIKDEPNLTQLTQASDTYKKLLELDPDHVPHVNLFPSLAVGGALGNINYENDYVKKWITLVGANKLKYLSLDIYPFLADGSFRETYYSDLDLLRRVALENGELKTSAYLQSVGIAGAYRRPNENELRYNVYSMLAYGVRYPVWFTYFTPDPATSGSEVFTSAIIDLAGNKTDLYVPFQKLNGEMKAIGPVLVQMLAQAVYHTGAKIPAGASPLPGWYFVQPVNAADECLVAQFKNWPQDGRDYAMIVNKSLTDTKTMTFSVGGSITGIGEISKTSGAEIPMTINVAENGSKSITLTFKPGEGILFGFKQ
jgi:hypothetical protein